MHGDAATGKWSWGVLDELESTVDPKPRGDDLLPRIGDYTGVWPNGGSGTTWSAARDEQKMNRTTRTACMPISFRFARAFDLAG